MHVMILWWRGGMGHNGAVAQLVQWGALAGAGSRWLGGCSCGLRTRGAHRGSAHHRRAHCHSTSCCGGLGLEDLLEPPNPRVSDLCLAIGEGGLVLKRGVHGLRGLRVLFVSGSY